MLPQNTLVMIPYILIHENNHWNNLCIGIYDYLLPSFIFESGECSSSDINVNNLTKATTIYCVFAVLKFYIILSWHRVFLCLLYVFSTKQKLNVAQKTFENLVIFTIDKMTKICGAALDYSTFLKGAVAYETNTNPR